VPAISELAGDRSLRGEVDWIVAKACARELHDRYPNAGALADDLARLREGQPITAAPRDSGYAGLFALRKYRVQIAAIAVALAAIVGALAYMARVEANRAREEAERNARLAGLLERARIQLVPLTGKDRGDVVDESKALPILEMLYAINLELLGGQANESQQSALVLARAYDRGDRHADSERIYRGLLEEAMKNDRRPGDQAFLRFMTAGAIRRAGPARAAEARGLLDQALAYWSTLPDRPATACQALIEKSFVARLEGNHEEQGRLLADAVACTEEEAQPGHLRRREAYGFMADFHREQGALDAALQWYGRALDGLDGAMSPTAAVWRTAWQGEVLWIEREQARTAGTPLDPAKEAELQAIIESVKARDPGNNRLGRWEARRD
jgi:serine/threonine-protein kinase